MSEHPLHVRISELNSSLYALNNLHADAKNAKKKKEYEERIKETKRLINDLKKFTPSEYRRYIDSNLGKAIKRRSKRSKRSKRTKSKSKSKSKSKCM